MHNESGTDLEMPAFEQAIADLKKQEDSHHYKTERGVRRAAVTRAREQQQTIYVYATMWEDYSTPTKVLYYHSINATQVTGNEPLLSVSADGTVTDLGGWF